MSQVEYAKNHDFTLSDDQQKTINDNKYMGINTFTMGPSDIYDGLFGMLRFILRRSVGLCTV